MRALVVSALLFLPAWCLAEPKIPDGFRDVKLGQKLSTIGEVTEVSACPSNDPEMATYACRRGKAEDERCYTRKSERLTLFEQPISNVTYCTGIEDERIHSIWVKLGTFTVELECADASKPADLRDYPTCRRYPAVPDEYFRLRRLAKEVADAYGVPMKEFGQLHSAYASGIASTLTTPTLELATWEYTPSPEDDRPRTVWPALRKLYRTWNAHAHFKVSATNLYIQVVREQEKKRQEKLRKDL